MDRNVSNLNELMLRDDSNGLRAREEQERRRAPTRSADGSVEVYFDELEDRLIEHIQKARYVFGCVAWMTNSRILEALASVRMVSLVVQKEDFLRPDLQPRSNWVNQLRIQYSMLHSFGGLHHIPGGLIDQLSLFDVERIQAVRCVGNHNQDKNPAFPRAHHKFIVFSDGRHCYGVWTGSFNFTANATKSLENALYITDRNIVQAYFQEYQHVFALSEPLDWTNRWVAPEYRIGT